MYSYQTLLEQNLPIYVRVQPVADIKVSWPKQIALLALVTTGCLTGFAALTYYTGKQGMHDLKPFGLDLDPMLMVFDVLLFVICIICMGLWLQEENHEEPELNPDHDPDKLSYIFPKANSLHVKDKAYDLANADSITLTYPYRVRVHFKNPELELLLYDDRTGYDPAEVNPLTLQKNYYHNALFVYMTGTRLPHRYVYLDNWWWNVVAGGLFLLTIVLPFLFQILEYKLYWVGFLAIPVGYLTFRVGQTEFRRRAYFSYAHFLNKHHLFLDKNIYRDPADETNFKHYSSLPKNKKKS